MKTNDISNIDASLIININHNMIIDHNLNHLEVRPCEYDKTEDIANDPDADDDVSDHAVRHKLDLDHCLGGWVGAEDDVDEDWKNEEEEENEEVG